MLVTARGILERATSPTFLSLYWPGLDTIAHIRGPQTAIRYGINKGTIR